MTDVLVADTARRPGGSRSRQMAIIYYGVLLALDIVALALISDALIPTLVGSVAVWGAVSHGEALVVAFSRSTRFPPHPLSIARLACEP